MSLIFEEAISSPEELGREISLLDYDGGIRLMVRYKGISAYAFISRGSDNEYLLAIYDYGLENGFPTPNRQLLFREFSSVELIMQFIGDLIDEPFRSFKY